jgi:putative colanic acid biosynthesis glycosyltransferase
MQLDIVTIHMNDFVGLGRTTKSLSGVTGKRDTRWILVDGDSNRQQAEDAVLFGEAATRADVCISELDEGIYDAMNKGTAQVRGDYVLYLNAGDELHPLFDPVSLSMELAGASPAMIWGRCHERFPGGEIVKVKNRSPAFAWYGMPVNHQNVLFRRDVLGDKPYDTHFQICADYDLVGRILKSGGDVYRTSMPIAIFSRGGLNEKNSSLGMDEEEILRTLHFGVPRLLSSGIRRLKMFNARLGRVPAIRRVLRRWF